jgi:hypothetical protein
VHDQIIDLIMANPGIRQRELAKLVQRTESWLSIIINSDAFKDRLAERKADLIDPSIVAGFEEKIRGMMGLAADVATESLEAGRDPDLAMKALEVGAKVFGSRREGGGVAGTNLFVVELPPQVATAHAWADRYRDAQPPEGRGPVVRPSPAEVIDVQPKEVA